mgnify:CR=1 FL=1
MRWSNIGSAIITARCVDLHHPVIIPSSSLVYKGSPSIFRLNMEDGVKEPSEVDATLTIDDVNTSFLHLSNCMPDASRLAVVGSTGPNPTTPLVQIIAEHLESSESDLPTPSHFRQEIDDDDDDDTISCFPIFAEELWLVPEAQETEQVDGNEVLKSFSLRLIAARCRTKRTSTFRRLAPPSAPVVSTDRLCNLAACGPRLSFKMM